ncbi:hypothetical protein [Ruminiclostridium papyrosolvens]|uniref:Uncharacterized protein n=1 Tax=Ruminiclostridium papyrosolvens C7 TaxID=1330534 RepID=U4R2D7_9FIRM|nr:hypothetical protein [Ruminiclostridium papyrosolvens]EPR12370.1 hypothetical protein L323_08715 [Ruminiclostridium papyrosolvens C7]
MIKVTQEIPEGRFCAEISRNNRNDREKCIFLDRDNNLLITRHTEGFVCRRHPEVILGMELSQETDKVVKCHACLKETSGGETGAKTGIVE